MKVGFSSPRGSFFVLALAPVLFVTGCRTNSNQATASLPAASNPSYPSNSLQAAPSNELDPIFASDEVSEPLPAPERKKPMPFKLRTGETLASYKVQKGDNLGKIAKLYGTSVTRIKSANGLSDDTIYAGKSYKIPTKKSESEIASASVPSSSGSSSGTVKTVIPTKATAPTPPSFTRTPIPSYNRPSSPNVISSSPSRSSSGSGSYTSSTAGSYKPPAARTFSPPPTSERPTFAPRTFDYDGPAISSPSRSASSITIPTEEASGSGAAFPTPTFGSGTSF